MVIEPTMIGDDLMPLILNFMYGIKKDISMSTNLFNPC